ncbi:MAG: hypothetical protein CVV47_15445 [Spirochaetae bacterium HGW-Spirochaetae-3]|jgi:hypothetical protein|nr:MAG: hypothetical protein CVV47_15445 [Spirochaetae bacterium HGW-Spirochaetae-3]
MTRASTLAAIRSVLGVSLAAAAGVALWYAMRLCEGAVAPSLSVSPEWLSLAMNAGIEETLRLGLALAAALTLRRLGREPGAASLAVIASCVVATLENASYMAAFPTLDSYWRLGYALPIHASAAVLYALVTAPFAEPGRGLSRRGIATVAASFLAAWSWHAAFNITAALAPFPALPAIGTALNVIAFAALAAATAIRYGYWSIYATR